MSVALVRRSVPSEGASSCARHVLSSPLQLRRNRLQEEQNRLESGEINPTRTFFSGIQNVSAGPPKDDGEVGDKRNCSEILSLIVAPVTH